MSMRICRVQQLKLGCVNNKSYFSSNPAQRNLISIMADCDHGKDDKDINVDDD